MSKMGRPALDSGKSVIVAFRVPKKHKERYAKIARGLGYASSSEMLQTHVRATIADS